MISTIAAEYRGVLRFFVSYRKFWLIFLAAVLIFSAVSGILMFSFFSNNADAVKEAINSVAEMFEGKSDIVINENGSISAVGLFKNNVMAMLLIALSGVIPFLFLALWSFILNIVIICITISAGIALGAFDGFGAFLLMAPHGIFELPALIISAGCGMMLCAHLSARLFRGKDSLTVATDHMVLELSRTFILVITPLLVAAAIFEAYVTPALFFLFA